MSLTPEYNAPAQYQSINPTRQSMHSQNDIQRPLGPVEQLFYPNTCKRDEGSGMHYHPFTSHSYPTNSSIVQNSGEIIEPRPTATKLRESDHGGIEPDIGKDAEWMERLTELPVELGDAYLPEEEPVVADAYESPPPCSVSTNDADGPPHGSRFYSNWIHDQMVSQKVGREEPMTTSDYKFIYCIFKQTISKDTLIPHYSEDAPFLLPLKWRRELYKNLFYPIELTITNGKIQDPFIEAVIESKVRAVRGIESFILRVWVELRVDPFPSLKYFMDDFSFLSNALKKCVKLTKLRDYIRFDQVIMWSRQNEDFQRLWKSRWEKLGRTGKLIAKNDTIKRNYVCGVFDVLFGIWQAPGRCWFHDGWLGTNFNAVSTTDESWKRAIWVSADATAPRCIHKGLYFWETPPPEPDTLGNTGEENVVKEASVSLVYLDACYIQYRGPFRFIPAAHISSHLTMTPSNEICIYTDWKCLLMLRHQQALVEDSRTSNDEISMFQLLSRSNRGPKDRRYGIGGDIRYIAYELLQTYVLLFFRYESEHGGYLYRHTHTLGQRWFNRSSEEIAFQVLGQKNICGVIDEIRSMFSTPEPRQMPESRDFRIFRMRLEGVNRALTQWRPRNFWHVLWYEGYSNDGSSVWGATIARYLVPLTVIQFFFALITFITARLNN
jgi:hypothetical protein